MPGGEAARSAIAPTQSILMESSRALRERQLWVECTRRRAILLGRAVFGDYTSGRFLGGCMSSIPASRLLAVFLTAFVGASPALHAQQASFPFQDPTRPIGERVDDLVGRMTLEEKASQLVNTTRAIPRLNVPEYNIWSEALHGVAGGGFATVFPQAHGLAATFDVPTLHEMAAAIAREGRVKYNLAAR